MNAHHDIQSICSPRPGPKQPVILGSTGMVGRSWSELFDRLGINYRTAHRPEFDLLNPEALGQCIRSGDDLVINAAAWTDVDGAESDQQSADQANGHSVRIIAERCKQVGATLIHYSTDYVFDGTAETPYPIDAPINPSNAYGRSKALGESKIRESGCPHIIIRTSWVYAPWGKNFVRTIASLAKSKPELKVVSDQRGRPTSAPQLAQTSLNLYSKGACGTWHASDGGECTWFDLASQIAKHINPSCTVHPCSSDLYPRPAHRPPYSVLDITETESLCGPLVSWRRNIDEMLKAGIAEDA